VSFCQAGRATDFISENLAGSRFGDVYLTGARFHDVDLSGARFHLVFATDARVKRAILGEPSPWHPLDLPHDEMPDEPSVPRDRGARPSLDEVLALRADHMATVRQVIAGLTDEKLAGLTEPVTEPGYPEPESFAVRPPPAGHPQRGVGAPALRRTGLRCAGGPVVLIKIAGAGARPDRGQRRAA
jgi:hypothetical protein